MAKAYLGKISALVTANTSDFNSKLNASAKEVRSFASAMQSSLTRAESAATASLRGIYTESQKVSRALQAVSSKRLDFKGFDTSTFAKLQQAVDTFKQIQNAATNIFDPLANAARVVERLSASVQREFDPAMKSAQRSAEFLNQQLERGGVVGERAFERVRQKVVAAAEAADRLAEAEALAGRGPRGTELAFAAPRVRDTLTASAATRQRAAEAPAALLDDGRIARDVQKLASIDALIVKRRAQIEQGIALNVDTSQAQRSLESLAALSERVRGRIDGALNEGNRGRAAADNEIALLQRRERAAKEAEDRRLAGLRRIEDNEIASLVRREQAAKEVESRRLAEQQRAQDNETAALISRERAARDAERTRLDETRVSPFDAGLSLARRARRMVGGDIPDTGNPAGAALETGRQVDRIGQSIAQTRQRIDSLPDGIRAGLIPELRRVSDLFVDVAARGAGATADQIARANREAERLAQNTARTQRGLNFGEQFGGPGRRGLEFGLQEVSLRGYTAQLQVLQRALAGAGSEARGPALNAFNQLRSAISQAATRGTLDTRATRQEIARLTDEAVRASAAAAGISPGRLGRSLQRAGDIGRNSFANLGLGIQQAVFAVEDFFSVTGGLDQRIRAAGNNISQLGFVLGGTQGLIAGVAAAITGQLVAALIRWQNAGVGSEDRVKSLNDSLSRQKSLIESLADSFSSLADEIGRLGFSKQGADAAQFAKQLDEIRKKQREFNTEQAAALDPEVQRQRGIITARERQLEKTEDPGERVRLNLDIQEARTRERARLRQLENEPAIDPRTAFNAATRARFDVDVAAGRDEQAAFQRMQADQAGGRRAMQGLDRSEQTRIARERILDEQDRLRREIAQNTGVAAESDVNVDRRRRLAELEAARLQLESGATKAANALEIEVTKAARYAAQQIGKAQDSVATAIESGVPGAVGLQVSLDRLDEALQEAQKRLNDAQKRARETGSGGDLRAAEQAQREVDWIKQAINGREQEVRAMDAIVASIKMFDEALSRVSAEADQNLQSSQRAADEARANDLERGTERTAEARRRADADLRRQQELRNRVDSEVAVARDNARRDPAVVKNEERIAEIDRQLQTEGVLAPGQRERLIRERENLRQENERTVQQRVDTNPGVVAARDASTQEERRRQQRERGFEAMRSPATRAGIELGQTLQDARAAFDSLGAVDQVIQRSGFEKANRRLINEAMRSTAPAIFNMADEVQNAVLQGPSRAALQASDITTSQGASELNRLLRGDDSARNQNLVELQKQSQNLQRLVQIAEQNGAPPGVFDN